MKKLSGLALGLLLAAGFGVAQANDAEKLKELERAMNAASAEQPAKPKVRTRAIVFDNQPSGQAEPAAQIGTPQAAGPRDCSALPPDVRAVGVDFAIQFNSGSAVVSPASEGTLNQIAKVLALSPDRCIIVEGHTDAVGNLDKNMSLSMERANSVVTFISTRNGIDRKRLVPVGKGPTDPLPNLDARDSKNRRVVFKVVTG